MNNLEFISYDGEFPNLCSGVLTVKINDREVKFGHHYEEWDYNEGRYLDEDKNNPNYAKFWVSGGEIIDEEDCGLTAISDEWMLSVFRKNYPQEIIDLMPQLIELFNENVQWGCCGGCI